MNEFDHCIFALLKQHPERLEFFRPFSLLLKQRKNTMIKFIFSRSTFQIHGEFLYYHHQPPLNYIFPNSVFCNFCIIRKNCLLQYCYVTYIKKSTKNLPVKVKKIGNNIIFIATVKFTKTNLYCFFSCGVLWHSLREKKCLFSIFQKFYK